MEQIASIVVYKEDETEDKINFYITHNTSYGIKIEKGKEEITLPDISEEKCMLKELLGEVLDENNNITQLSYMIEDYLYNKKAKTV